MIDVNQNQSSSDSISIPSKEESIVDPNQVKQDINEKLTPIQNHGLALSETLNILCEFSGDYSQQTKLAALEWLHTLMDVTPHKTLLHSEIVFPSLFKFVIDPASGVRFLLLSFYIIISILGYPSWVTIGCQILPRKRSSLSRNSKL